MINKDLIEYYRVAPFDAVINLNDVATVTKEEDLSHLLIKYFTKYLPSNLIPIEDLISKNIVKKRHFKKINCFALKENDEYSFIFIVNTVDIKRLEKLEKKIRGNVSVFPLNECSISSSTINIINKEELNKRVTEGLKNAFELE
jgi:hypothetical protein